MPTYEWTARFRDDLHKLTSDQHARFRAAVAAFVADLRAQGAFRPGLRVKGVRGASGVYEMTWAPDGRATFSYGDERRPGEAHIIWRRVGGHDIFGQP